MRDGILVADVLRERVTGVAIENDDASRALKADKQVVLAPLVIVEAAYHALVREGEVRLHHPVRQVAVAPDLTEPAALVLVAAERDADDALDTHGATRVVP